MFIVKPTTHVDYKAALNLIADYSVDYNVMQKLGKTHIVVMGEEGREGHFRLCEKAFQMNFRQSGKVCFICEGVGEEVCDHLTFTELP
jgi:hypothetical protein